jgi:amidase
MSLSPDEYAHLDAVALAELVARREVSAAELATAARHLLDERNPALNAVIHRNEDALVASAIEADAVPEERRGALHGVPFLLKDIVAGSAGDPLHAGMCVLRDAGYRAPHDSWLTQRFRRAGLVLAGRTNTPELATSITCEPLAYGATRNPWDLTRSPGGSSGGSAAAVAAGIVPIAHGNDMGGSIRIPASCCGLIGLKPSRGRSTIGPDFGELWGPLTHEHVVTRSVRDCAAVLDAIAGPGVGDPYTAPPPLRPYALEVGADPGRLRIGMRTHVPVTGPQSTPRVLRPSAMPPASSSRSVTTSITTSSRRGTVLPSVSVPRPSTPR